MLTLCIPQQRYKRALADSDTVRRRTQKFVEDAKIFGKAMCFKRSSHFFTVVQMVLKLDSGFLGLCFD